MKGFKFKSPELHYAVVLHNQYIERHHNGGLGVYSEKYRANDQVSILRNAGLTSAKVIPIFIAPRRKRR